MSQPMSDEWLITKAVNITLCKPLPEREPTWGDSVRKKLFKKMDDNNRLGCFAELLKKDPIENNESAELAAYRWELYRQARAKYKQALSHLAARDQEPFRPKQIDKWTPENLPATLPQPLEHFELIERYKKGAEGIIYIAIDWRNLDSLYVIKFLTEVRYEEIREKSETVDRLKKGLTTSLKISHPNIAPTREILDFGMLPRLGGTNWPPNAPCLAYVMNYYPLSLHDALARYPGKHYSKQQVELWMREIVEAVNELHCRYELVHRDVKPSNILFELPKRYPFEGWRSLEGAHLILGDITTAWDLGKAAPVTVNREEIEQKDPYKHEDYYTQRSTDCETSSQICLPEMDNHAVTKVLQELSKMADKTDKGVDELLYKAFCYRATVSRRTKGEQLWREVRLAVTKLVDRLVKVETPNTPQQDRVAEIVGEVRKKVCNSKPDNNFSIYAWAIMLTIRTVCKMKWKKAHIPAGASPSGDSIAVLTPGDGDNRGGPLQASMRQRDSLTAAIRAMKSLTPWQDQRVLALHLAGLPAKEIAEVLATSPQTIMIVLNNCLGILPDLSPANENSPEQVDHGSV